MKRLDPALLIGLLGHGENGAIVRLLTAEGGLQSAYVHGGRGRRLRPVLQIGNRLSVDLVARGETALPVASVQLLAANMAMLHGPAGLALVDHVTTLAATLLPEGVAQPQLFPLIDALLAAAGAGAEPLVQGAALVRLELALLAELGLGLDLRCCAATGSPDDLAFVSPRSRQAVSRGAGEPWAARLLPLPAFLIGAGAATMPDVAAGLRLTGHFLARDALAGQARREAVLHGRARVVAGLTGEG